MAERDDFEDMQDQADDLRQSMGDAAAMAATFDTELKRMRTALADAGQDIKALERGLSGGLKRAFDGVVLDGMKASDALRTVADAMIRTTYNAAIQPVTDRLGGMMAVGVGTALQAALPFAAGGGFAQGRVMPFARGGVVSGPMAFPMRGGTGLMGEAGPEAIMPLSRGRDGKLGVRAEAGRAVTVVMNITTPDVQGFQRSHSQIAAQMGRALSRGARNR